MPWECIRHFSNETMLQLDSKWICWPHYIGRNILLCGKKKSFFPFHILVGPDWSIFVQTLLEINAVTIVFIIFIAQNISPIITYIAIILLCLTTGSFTITACTDPGIVYNQPGQQQPMHDIEDSNSSTAYSHTLTPHPNPNTLECQQCHVNRPVTARHCYKCGVCIDKLDHHCPFTGKCIGKNNMIPFLIFLGSLNLLGLLVFGVSAYYIFGVLIVNAAKK